MKKVLVTGVTGRTGAIAWQKLCQRTDEFIPSGFARSEAKVKQLFGSTEGYFFGDVRDKASLEGAIANCQALIILSSAIAKMKVPPSPGQRPIFEYEPGGMPEEVDYLGQKHQIDLAKAAGVEQIVLVGSMGGTNENHPLNSMANGKVLIWKRRTEQYLIDSGINYTIIRAGNLIDEPGGMRELLVGKDDSLLNAPNGIPAVIPRADVAEVVVQALREPKAINKAFDIIAQPPHESSTPVKVDFDALFAQTTPGL